MKSRPNQLEVARAMIEIGTGKALGFVRLNESVPPYERRRRKLYDRFARAELARAKRGLKKFERAIRA